MRGRSEREAIDLVTDASLELSSVVANRLLDGDGTEATRRIHARWPDINVVMLTGVGASDLLPRAIDAGYVGVLAKDRPGSEVVEALRSASRGESVWRTAELANVLGRWRSSQEKTQSLTVRELEVLHLLGKARTTKEIAGELFVSVNTVRNHVSSILTKLGAHSKLEAVAIAVHEGIIVPGDIG